MSDGDRAVEVHGFTQSALTVIDLRCDSHQSCIDNEQVTAGIELQQFDPASHHVWQSGLLAAGCELVRKRHLCVTEHSEDLRASPARDRFQFGFGPHDIEAVTTQFEK